MGFLIYRKIMIDQHFNPKSSEPKIYAKWDNSGAFRPNPDEGMETFSMVIPPPNVTGSLHLGHALNNTLQDVLARFERMRGKSVLWQPGLDHAGIATQMVVERQLAEAGGNENRASLGREEFIKRVWAWKDVSGGTINNQLRRLGASCDWSREKITFEPEESGQMNRAVRKVFTELYKSGLIYRDKRLVNWDPHFETAISDLEVENRETTGSMWKIAYPYADGSGEVIVATTRPETLLGDVAVAVHPKDERYKDKIGKMVKLPLTGREIPIIADDYADMEKGTGAVKITPAHDFNDFKVGKRHNLTPINIFNSKAHMNENVPEKYFGLERFAARKQILADLEELGLLRGEDENPMTQPYGDRSGVIIEPWLTDQWYVDAKKLAVKAIDVVKSGEVKFVPDNWKDTYYTWMENIEPWCVSRQLWWGHRIPAWYDTDGNIFVEEDFETANAAAKAKHGKEVELSQDTDVLDTWFSSGLWPFSTLGWPEDTNELKRFYPTTTLVTMFDIIFFWVARMMMMGLHFTGKAPFTNIIIHSRVVDEKGKKMSKSKGNIIDPVPLIDEFGADALRFCLAIAAGPGRDIRMSAKRVEGYRNFGTKLWNAARFAQMNECVLHDGFDPANVTHTLNKWIITQAVQTTKSVEAALNNHRFDEAASEIYNFVWAIFCDWYLELSKPILGGDDEELKTETRNTMAWVLENTLKTLHPFMPFITEELWEKTAEFGPSRDKLLISEKWPVLSDALINAEADKEVNWVIEFINGVRSLRAETNISAGTKIPAILVGASQAHNILLEKYQNEIDRLARLEYSSTSNETPKGAVTFVINEAIVALPLAGVIDIEAEKARLSKEIARCNQEIGKINAKLENENFVARAPLDVVEEQRERLHNYEIEKAQYSNVLQRLDEI